MKRMVNLLLGCVAAVSVVLIVLISWRIIDMTQKEKMHQAIWDAWCESNADDAPAYLQAIDLETYFVLEDIEKGDPYVVTVTVCGLDLGGRLKEIDPAEFPDTQDERVLNDYLITLVEESEYTEVQTMIYAWPEGDGYRIQFSETFVDAMTGRVYSYTRDLVNEMTGGAK